MSKNLVQAPKLPQVLEPYRLGQDIWDERLLSSVLVENHLWDRDMLDGLRLDTVYFINTSFADLSWRGMDLVDVVFEKCDFSNANVSDAVIHRSRFISCKFVGTNFSGSTIRHTTFEGCLLDFSTFGFSDIKNTRFSSSSLRQTEFYECKTKHLFFEDNQMEQANLAGTNLNGVDLSTNTFESLTVSRDQLEGCIISEEQAVGFVKMLGMIVKM